MYQKIFTKNFFAGVCVPYRCKDHSEAWGGRILGKNFSTVGQKATFECKEGYFMPNLTVVSNVYNGIKQKSAAIVCQNVPDKLVPVSPATHQQYL